MMKLKRPIVVLAFLLSNQSSKAELNLVISEHSGAERPSVSALIQQSAVNFWFSEESTWKVLPKKKTVIVDFTLVSDQHWAQTSFDHIRLNVYTRADQMDLVIKHELSHSFLKSYCPRVDDPFIHEFYAYWRSGDYQRMLYGHSSIYTKADAYNVLKTKSTFDKKKSLATSRIIKEIIANEKVSSITAWYASLFRKCNDESFFKNQGELQTQLLTLIQGEELSRQSGDDSGFLLFDSAANEMLESEGHWEKEQPTGSTLKPFLVSFFADVKKDKFKREVPEWECKDGTEIKKWNYKRALNYSCNGFFLDSKMKESELENYARVLNSVVGSSYSYKGLNNADVIGLWPTIRLSLLDLAKLYDYIIEQDPETIRSLRQTAVNGTLSDSIEAKWFVENEIALKSGTTTKLDMSIERGYLVAVINIGNAPKIAILFRSGQRPIDLLKEMRDKIQKLVKYREPKARVQVLSAFNQKALKVDCPTVLMVNGVTTNSSAVDFNSKSIFKSHLSCVGSPFNVKVDDRTTRRLYGDLTFQKSKLGALVPRGRSEKNMRAQLGSQIILETSESHYLRSVFFSEGAEHRPELKKALLMVIKNNLWNSKQKPICDTTVCQVFNLNYEQVTATQKKSINELIWQLGTRQLKTHSWLEFSLGGTQSWLKNPDTVQLKEFLQVKEIKEISGIKEGDQFEFTIKNLENTELKHKTSCEQLRSQFKLRSCPTSIEKQSESEYVFEGQGDGHERGMPLTEANSLAIQGYNFDQILENYYGLKVIETNRRTK